MLLFELRSKLEHGLNIWNPHHIKYVDNIKRLQKKLVKYLFHNNLIPDSKETYDYMQCLQKLDMEPLEKRRIKNDLNFVIESIFKITYRLREVCPNQPIDDHY